MDQAAHSKIVSFIWGIADDVLRDLFKRGKYPVLSSLSRRHGVPSAKCPDRSHRAHADVDRDGRRASRSLALLGRAAEHW
jgi:hypothetical protein